MGKQSTTLVASNEEIVRKTSEYHPSIWGDYFINNTISPTPAKVSIRAEELKEQIKNLFRETNDILQIINFIDAIQLLGLDYQFEKEIDAALILISKHDHAKNYELYEISLQFRLLRQHGFYVSADVFNKFRDEEGNFTSTLNEDVKGLLSLYNAAFLRIHGEYILDEAILFTKSRLASLLGELKQPLAALVSLFLETPLCLRNRRLARKYIPIYQEEERRNDAILEFAKLDFNLVQSFHQEELKKISIWRNDLALAKSLNFVRDRLVECYYWILNVYFEPQYSRARLICTKVISILSIMDDIYDNYSTLQESRLLTEAIQRWEPQAVDIVPEYLKDFYLRFLRTFKEFENELESDEKYRISFLQDEIKAVSTSYFIEVKWGIEKYVPTLEEHLSNSLITAGYAALACASYIGMGPVATKEAFEWVASFPKILKTSSLIGRLMDDIKSHKLEQERDHAASTVESYMKEFATDEKEAYKNLMEMVEDAWKDHNKEYLNPTQIARVLVERIVNLSRIIEEFYKHSDSYTNSKTTMKDNIYMVLVESVPI